MVLDAMDQSKFAWPRSFRIGGKEFESFTRPRSHIYGGLCHGHYSLLTISHADTCRGSSMTVEILAHMLTLLSKTIDIRDWTINVLLDNAAGSNKNNCVFSFFGALIYFGLVGHVNVLFLRVGHTHEDRLDFLVNLLQGLNLFKNCTAFDLFNLAIVVSLSLGSSLYALMFRTSIKCLDV